MSLTRAQWLEMYQAIRKIEREVLIMNPASSRRVVYAEIDKIKVWIQSVVGQLE